MGRADRILQVSGWMGAAMWVENGRLVIRRPPSGKTEVPLSLVEAFVFTNASIGQKGYGAVVRGGSLHQERAGARNPAMLSDDPYLLPLKPGRKNRAECEVFGEKVLAMRDAATQDGLSDAASSPIGELKQLAALRDEGVLTEEEFAIAKARVLGKSGA